MSSRVQQLILLVGDNLRQKRKAISELIQIGEPAVDLLIQALFASERATIIMALSKIGTAALALAHPRYFGYDVEYIPVEERYS